MSANSSLIPTPPNVIGHMKSIISVSNQRDCDFCEQDILSHQWFQCRVCYNVDLCIPCSKRNRVLVLESIQRSRHESGLPTNCHHDFVQINSIDNSNNSALWKERTDSLICQIRKSREKNSEIRYFNHSTLETLKKAMNGGQVTNEECGFVLRQGLMKGKKKRVLSLDGGGLRGYLTAAVLKHCEINSQNFDVIAGTSIGGLLAFSLIVSDKSYNLDSFIQILENYQKYFVLKWRSYFTFGSSLFSAKYTSDYIYKAIDDIFGLVSLPTTTTFEKLASKYGRDLVLTAYDYEHNQSFVFSSSSTPQFPVIHALKATMAAPTYFDPYPYDDHYFVDGGVFANDPQILGLLVAKSTSQPFDTFQIFSVGTGNYHQDGKGTKQYGIISWMFTTERIFDTLMNSTTSSIELTSTYLGTLPQVERMKINFEFGEDIKLDDPKIIRLTKDYDFNADKDVQAFKEKYREIQNQHPASAN